ncbi:protein-methionine-sulfoxide reductase heme-binding subunit MsrQ [Thalassotalea euphylliae]|uniref:Protein-methionine-sulfoxide reductase heme-binding subunit MsrQ n=1 Tax=Thalassotalea euphylliae TaxID=1655234 RepID=A0A3E0U2V1_9GAMM|nr:protein-methionine-sulfoxide reductase heme-binding subunit MsrQ [Thalassotalea euphylliae]REL30342.1 protein-methionine-sulfoxide reductase heme-binding subunit MsrQ [Thalassotalea euphylliae]
MIVVVKTLVHLAAALPLLWLYYGAVNDTIGADPVERVIHFTGIGALNILLISLAITPLAKRFKKPVLLKFRRLLGLWVFTYALFHLLNFLFFELQFDWRLFVDEVIDRPYITVGMFAFAILLPLAVTSWSKIKRKMGKSWQQLHNWVYIAAVAIWVHFYWSIKSDIYEPGLYAVGLIWLLTLRKDRISRWLFKRK